MPLVIIGLLGLICCGISIGRRTLRTLAIQREGPTVDPNMKCPACGGRNGSLKCLLASPGGQKVPKPDPMIEHTCNICGAKFYEKTIVPAEIWFVH